MDRKQASQIVKIVILVSGLFLVGVVVFIIFNLSRDKVIQDYEASYGKLTTPIQRNYHSEISISYSNNLRNTLSSNEVYEIDKNSYYYPSKKLVTVIANAKKLKLVHSDETISFYEGNSMNLSYDSKAKSISLDIQTGPNEKQGQIPSDKQAQVIAKSQLEEIGLWPYAANYRTTYRYYSAFYLNFYEVPSRDKASLIGVNFTGNIKDVPLTMSRISSGEIEVLIDISGNVQQISYSYRPVLQNNFSTYPIRTLTDALSSIRAKKAELHIPFEAEIPTSVELNNIIFSYRVLYDQQAIIQPVYVFEGIDSNENLATFIVPAVTDQYLNEPPKVE